MPARRCDASATAALLDWPSLITALERAVVEAADGRIACPDRLVTPLQGDGTMLSMPASAADIAVHKLITVTPGNKARGLPTIQGQLTVFDTATGCTSLVLDGPTVTGRRTAAISLLAMRLLSSRPVATVLLIGTGIQARHHVDALEAMHPHARVRVVGSSAASTARFCRDHADRAIDVGPAKPDETVDVVLTCTTSPTPVYCAAARVGTLIVATGSFRPAIAEIAAPVVRASACYVDDPRSAIHEGGDLIQAGIAWADVGSLADLLRGTRPPTDRPLLFKSVGSAAWDLAAARVAAGL